MQRRSTYKIRGSSTNGCCLLRYSAFSIMWGILLSNTIQQFRQRNRLRISIRLKLTPVFFFWNLLIQRRSMKTDVFSLFLADFFCNCVIAALLGSVKHSEAHFVTPARSLGKYAVLMFLALCKLGIMLCHPRKDIDALSYVNNLAIQQDRINARTLKFGCQSLAL